MPFMVFYGGTIVYFLHNGFNSYLQLALVTPICCHCCSVLGQSLFGLQVKALDAPDAQMDLDTQELPETFPDAV